VKTPSIKATEALVKPPVAAAEENKVNTSWKRVPPQFNPRRRRSKIKVSLMKS